LHEGREGIGGGGKVFKRRLQPRLAGHRGYLGTVVEIES
jgi:hypothetical protein